MKFIFKENISALLKLILNCAKLQNINVYFVGGIVRDNILNYPVNDIDLIVNSNAIEFAKSFPSEIKIKSIHKDFCTVKIEYDGLNVDIASTREEHYPYSGCLPVVDCVGVDIQKDYIRRDFSVNSLYAKIDLYNNELTYELIDLLGGIEDIQNRTLRVLHKNSYIDDPTRILRGIDFKFRFGFDFSYDDKILINSYIQNPNIENASHDRILSVFKQILSRNNSDIIFRDIVENKYYKIINNSDIKFDLNLIYKLANQFAFNKSEFYLKILENKDINIPDFCDIYETFVYCKKQSVCNLAYYFYKTKNNFIFQYLSNMDFKLLINGDDLLNLGYNQGSKIGKIIRSLFCEKFNNILAFQTKVDELNYVKTHFPLK